MADKYWHPTGSGTGNSAWESANWNAAADGSGAFSALAAGDVAIFTGQDLTPCTTAGDVACAGLQAIGGTGGANDIPAVAGPAPDTLTLGGNLAVSGDITLGGGVMQWDGRTITCRDFTRYRDETGQPNLDPVTHTDKTPSIMGTCDIQVSRNLSSSGLGELDTTAAPNYVGKVGFTHTGSGNVWVKNYANHNTYAGHLRLAWGAGIVTTITAGSPEAYASKISVGNGGGTLNCSGYLTIRRADTNANAGDPFVQDPAAIIHMLTTASHLGITTCQAGTTQGKITLSPTSTGMLLVLPGGTFSASGNWDLGGCKLKVYLASTNLTIPAGLTVRAPAGTRLGKDSTPNAVGILTVNGTLITGSLERDRPADTSLHSLVVGAAGRIWPTGAVGDAGITTAIAAGGDIGRHSVDGNAGSAYSP